MSEVIAKKALKKEYLIKVKDGEVEDTNIEVYKIIISNLKDQYTNTITVSNWVTGNCQVTMVGFANNIVIGTHHKPSLPYEDYNKILEDEIINVIKDRSKRQVLIDIEKYLEKSIVEVISRNSENYVELFNSPYINSTGTEMVSIMFKWNASDVDEDHPDHEDYDEDYDEDDF